MAEATAMSGRLDTPVAAGMLVIGALLVLVALHKIVVTVK